MSMAIAEDTGKGAFQARVQTGRHSLLMDEPVSAGGQDCGPNPFDLLCAAVASCTVMTLKLYAARKGWMLPQLRVHVTHHKESAEARDRFECRLELGEVTADQRERLLHIAQRCPVHLLLERGADLPTIAASEEQGPLAA